MRRPGPLKELPLDLFLPSNIPANNVFKATPSKRPVSPGAITLGPAKRRILHEELFFSPEKGSRSPSHGSKVPRPPLDGPESPARKLHFGVPGVKRESSHLLTPNTPDTSSSSRRIVGVGSSKVPSSSTVHKLAPSPELKLKTRSSHRRTLSENSDDEIKRKTDFDPSPAGRNSVTIPRELPALLDRHSIHHPGFDIHRDPHFFLLYGRVSPIPDQAKDQPKENIPPLKQTRKVEPTTPGADKDADMLLKFPSFPHTPRKKHAAVDDQREVPTSPTPRRPTTRLNAALRTPLATPIAVKMERKEGRRLMLEEELDDGSTDDGDDLTQSLF